MSIFKWRDWKRGDTDAPTEKGIVPVVKAPGAVGVAYWGDILRPLFYKFRWSYSDEDQEDSSGGSSSDAACAAVSSDNRVDDKSSGSDEPWWEEDDSDS